MHSYLIFGADNSHPLAWLLHKQHRHVWCIIADTEHNTWVSYDWAQGLPELRTEAALDFDIKTHYEAHGYDVVAIPEGERAAVQGPIVLNNCVGHVKSVLGIRGFALVPHQLYKLVTKRLKREAEDKRRLNMMSAPGFGSPKMPPMPAMPAYVPPPPPPPLPPRKPQDVRNKEAEERTGSAERQRKLDAAKKKKMAEVDPLSSDYSDTLL